MGFLYRRVSSGFGKRGARWTMKRVFKSMDFFSKEMPGFNVGGETHVRTPAGGLCSILLFIVALSYGLLKSLQLIEKDGAVITDYEQTDYFSLKETVGFNDINLRMAFTLENYKSGYYAANDPRYTKWIVRHYVKKDGKSTERLIPYHKCTKEELAEFNPIAKNSSEEYDLIVSNEDRGFFCIEWSDED